MYDIATDTRRLLAYYKEIHFMLTYLWKESGNWKCRIQALKNTYNQDSILILK